MSKTWGIGAWALDAERAEDEEREHQMAKNSQISTNESQSFPSLKEATSSKPKKKKPITLSELNTGIYVGPGGGSRSNFSSGSKGLTPDEMLRLPTGPKERSANEIDHGRLGGGFRSYDRRSDDRDGSWGQGGGGGGRRSYGGFDEERRERAPPRVSDFDQPSRADGVDNWASVKKSVPVVSMDSGRNDRYASLGGGSRADEVDNWAAGKKPIQARSTSFGSGFRDSSSGFRDSGSDSDRWSRGSGLRDGDKERPRIVLNPPRGDGVFNEVVRTRASPFGVARPREEILAEKGLDWRKLDSDIEIRKTSRPTSSQSVRPSSSQSSRPESPVASQLMEVGVKPRAKVNPFGDAKPREVLLQEQGKDWRKIDLELEHRGVDRPETQEEMMLKEEIEHLKKELADEAEVIVDRESTTGPAVESISLREQIISKERDLELLIRELDDKVRFGQRASDRPSSGAGRVAGLPDRPPSQSGLSESSRSMEFMDRPRSRGAGDSWTRSVDDRRAFQGSRERGFLGNRDIDRPKSRERW
ncbi:eukaryotic translation initiation factor 4B2-like [Tasmannia lanceolata]|uniref:eukaryotic translation initiation factor 4B2-like n=1 Tax=Tasmannia lanceolata TaxID=3420 RepID=UPI0040643450